MEMSRKARIVKDTVKGCGCEKPTFGTDPNDPWSAKANITETALLDKYLKSRGINPQFASKDVKVAHSKTNAYKMWATQHLNDPVKESISAEHTPTEKRLHALKKAQHMNKEIRVADGHKQLHSEATDKKDTVTFDIPLLIRVLELAREDLKSDMDLHRVVERLIELRKKGMLTMDDYDTVANIKEAVEYLNELSPELLNRYRDKAGASAKDLASKGEYKKANKRWMGHMKSTGKQIEKMFKKEDVFHGSTAATQMPFDGANNPDDVIPAKRKNMKEMSKSARIIKSIYKKKGIKEDMFDHEKEDKPVASPGKKAKLQKPGVDAMTKEAPQAAAVLSGGKTMTGAPRDTIEIDPMMKTKKQATFGSEKPIK
jgi:hypothetical protein